MMMRQMIAGIAAFGLVLGASVAAQQAQGATRNAWDGVYSADQAAQGKTLFVGGSNPNAVKQIAIQGTPVRAEAMPLGAGVTPAAGAAPPA